MHGTVSVLRPYTAAEQDSDRRKLPRRSVSGDAMAVFTDGPGAGRLVRVRLADASWNGLGVSSDLPVEVGSCVSIMPEHSMMPRQTGVVVRCDANGNGYDIGIRCRAARAAA